MSKLVPLIKLHIKLNKIQLITALLMPTVGLLLLLCTVIPAIIMGNVIPSYSGIAYLSTFSLFFITVTTLQGFAITLQYSVRMSCTRKEYFISTLAFYLLLSFAWSILIVILFSIEALLFHLFGVDYTIEIFNIVFFNSFNAYTPFYIFSSYFSLVVVLIGLAYFLNALISSFLKGKIMGITTAIILFIIYNAINFTQLKVILLNFLFLNKDSLLSIKLFIVGISGLLLSWSFIEKIDIDRLKIK